MLFTTETALNPPFIDLHTHRRNTASGVVAVSNFSQKDFENRQNTEGSFDFGCRIPDVGEALPKSQILNPKSKNTEGSLLASVGLHPWFLTKENFENDFRKITQLVDNQNIMAIGECGLDKLRGEDLAFQTVAFEAQIRLAESVSKPVLIHCVRAFNEVIAVKRRLNPTIPLIIHGFNKNVNVLNELLRHGFFISIGAAILTQNSKHFTQNVQNTEGSSNFGFRLSAVGDALPKSEIKNSTSNDASSFAKNLLNIPLDRLFFETDDAENVAISTIYETAATILAKDVNDLKSIVYANFERHFQQFQI